MRRSASKQVLTAIIALAGVVALTPRCVARQALTSQGRQIVEERNCRNCHSIAGKGASGPGPNLNQVTERRTQDWLRRWLHDPQTIKPGTIMPTFGFSDAQIDALIAFLGSLARDGRTENLPLTKSWLAVILTGLTFIAAWSMLERLGSPRRPWVRRETALFIHRMNGYTFTALVLLISVLCVSGLLRDAEEWSPRRAIHIAVAMVVLPALGFKIALARRYSGGLGSLLPPLGAALVIVTWILVAESAGFFFINAIGR